MFIETVEQSSCKISGELMVIDGELPELSSFSILDSF